MSITRRSRGAIGGEFDDPGRGAAHRGQHRQAAGPLEAAATVRLAPRERKYSLPRTNRREGPIASFRSAENQRAFHGLAGYGVIFFAKLKAGRMAGGIARRLFISALGGATVVWPLVARAQSGMMKRIGVITLYDEGDFRGGDQFSRRSEPRWTSLDGWRDATSRSTTSGLPMFPTGLRPSPQN